jgi:nicotinamide-nucleotide amidase
MASAQIIAIGSEMLTPGKVDTNSLFLTAELNRLGIAVTGKRVVGDSQEEIAEAIQQCLVRAELVFVSGGLGPTEDDLTREGAALALGRKQYFSEDVLERIAARFRKFNRAMTERNRKQAFILDGARVLPNPQGTAPGQAIETNGRLVFLLPGPPPELQPMVRDHVLAVIAESFPLRVLRTFTFRIARMPESEVDERAAPIYTQFRNPETTILASAGDITLQFTATADTEAEAETLLATVANPIRAELGARIYSEDGSSLEETLVSHLAARQRTLAVAESCTAGMFASRIGAVPGASEVFLGGLLVYTNQMKTQLGGVDELLLEQHGPVSAEVASELAVNTRDRTGADYAVAITGYAGPGGGTPDEPVGTVYVGVATPERVFVERLSFPGDRDRVRRFSTQWALDIVRVEVLREAAVTQAIPS